MIKLNIERDKCSVEAGGDRMLLSSEVMVAVHSLTDVLAKSLEISFEQASIVIMQSTTLVHQKLDKNQD